MCTVLGRKGSPRVLKGKWLKAIFILQTHAINFYFIFIQNNLSRTSRKIVDKREDNHAGFMLKKALAAIRYFGLMSFKNFVHMHLHCCTSGAYHFDLMPYINCIEIAGCPFKIYILCVDMKTIFIGKGSFVFSIPKLKWNLSFKNSCIFFSTSILKASLTSGFCLLPLRFYIFSVLIFLPPTLVFFFLMPCSSLLFGHVFFMVLKTRLNYLQSSYLSLQALQSPASSENGRLLATLKVYYSSVHQANFILFL